MQKQLSFTHEELLSVQIRRLKSSPCVDLKIHYISIKLKELNYDDDVYYTEWVNDKLCNRCTSSSIPKWNENSLFMLHRNEAISCNHIMAAPIKYIKPYKTTFQIKAKHTYLLSPHRLRVVSRNEEFCHFPTCGRFVLSFSPEIDSQQITKHSSKNFFFCNQKVFLDWIQCDLGWRNMRSIM